MKAGFGSPAFTVYKIAYSGSEKCKIIEDFADVFGNWGPKVMKATYHPGVHKYAVFVVCWTACLLTAGALVTSNDAALAVSDWPTSFGSFFPPLRYLTRLRINAAAARLRSTTDKLSAIAASAGYESVAAFVKSFRRLMGMPPGQYRKTHHSNRSK